MSRDFEELDYRETPFGELILRRRRLLSLGGMEVYEIKLGDAFLMSSLFHKAEVALAYLSLGELQGERWDVVVGGLGLGYISPVSTLIKYMWPMKRMRETWLEFPITERCASATR